MTLKAQGINLQAIGYTAQKAQGIDIQAIGYAAQKAQGINIQAIGSAAAEANARAKLTTLLQDDNHQEAQSWAAEFDAKYKIFGKVPGSLYDSDEIGKLARNAIYVKKCITVKGLGAILQLGASREGKADSARLRERLRKNSTWSDKRMEAI